MGRRACAAPLGVRGSVGSLRRRRRRGPRVSPLPPCDPITVAAAAQPRPSRPPSLSGARLVPARTRRGQKHVPFKCAAQTARHGRGPGHPPRGASQQFRARHHPRRPAHARRGAARHAVRQAGISIFQRTRNRAAHCAAGKQGRRAAAQIWPIAPTPYLPPSEGNAASSARATDGASAGPPRPPPPPPTGRRSR